MFVILLLKVLENPFYNNRKGKKWSGAYCSYA